MLILTIEPVLSNEHPQLFGRRGDLSRQVPLYMVTALGHSDMFLVNILGDITGSLSKQTELNINVLP